MPRRSIAVCAFLALILFSGFSALRAGDQPVKVKVQWNKVIRVSKTEPTLLVGAAPPLWRTSPVHNRIMEAIKNLGADDVRYAVGQPYPHIGVAELKPPTATRTYWDFSHVDSITEDVMKALDGHSVVMNFAVIPQWMFKTPKPVPVPAEVTKKFWGYEQGTDLRDPSGKEVADYMARVVSWYTKGGFTDELGKWHASGHHYKINYWEVLNEPDIERGFTWQQYTRIYDAVTAAIHKVSPDTKFVGMSDSFPPGHPEFYRYFLNPKNHKPGTPLDMISYHFYAVPNADEPPEAHQFTFFNQADRFLEIVGYIETIRKMLSPTTGTMVNEIGTMLPEDWGQTKPGYHFMPIRPAYWNLSAAIYAYVYAGLARMGIDAAGESGIPTEPGMWPSIAMLSWKTGLPNARYWVLKMIHDNLHPGDRIVDASADSGNVLVQAYATPSGGQKLLLVNKRARPFEISIPGARVAKVEFIDEATGNNPPASIKVAGSDFALGKFGVAVATLEK
jgi:Glycosyl hydrolases family 39